ncbi:MAG: TolC family protein [Candidatus Cryptobacteroides sp.]
MKRNVIIILTQALCINALAQSEVTLSLEQCRSMSSSNDVAVRNATLDVSSAEALKNEALSEYFPKIAISSNAYYAFNPLLQLGLEDVLGKSDGARNVIDIVEAAAPLYGFDTSWSFLDYGYGATLSLTQPIYAGGRIVNGNRLASLNLQAAKLKQSYASEDKTAEVDRKYWQVVALEEKMISLHQAIATLDTLANDVRNACEAGLALDTDTLQVSIERKRLQSSMSRLKSGIRLAKMDLFNAIGQPFSYFEANSDDKAPWIDSITLGDRPDNLLAPQFYYVDEYYAAQKSEQSQLLSLNVESYRVKKQMAIGEALPQVGLGASYGYGRMIGDRGRWNGVVFLSVKIPLTDYWKSSCKMKQYGNEALKAENDRVYLNEQIVLELRKLWEDMISTYDQMQIESDALSLAEIQESRTMDLYRSGQSTLSDVLSARTDTRLALDNLTDARIAYSNALSAYLSRTAACRKGDR